MREIHGKQQYGGLFVGWREGTLICPPSQQGSSSCCELIITRGCEASPQYESGQEGRTGLEANFGGGGGSGALVRMRSSRLPPCSALLSKIAPPGEEEMVSQGGRRCFQSTPSHTHRTLYLS